mmetsp:Transcript_33768/g.72050  ORF Transcript_33768/g.72050 Transcript_33768/m.72050 type:complete len:254 (+) Transcript_33768:213-974(+)
MYETRINCTFHQDGTHFGSPTAHRHSPRSIPYLGAGTPSLSSVEPRCTAPVAGQSEVSSAAHHCLRGVLHPDGSARPHHFGLAPLGLAPPFLEPHPPRRHVAHLALDLRIRLKLGELGERAHPRLLCRLGVGLELDCLLIRDDHPLQRHRPRAEKRTQPAGEHRLDLAYHRQRNHARLVPAAALATHSLPGHHGAVGRERETHARRLACADQLHLRPRLKCNRALLPRLIRGSPCLERTDWCQGGAQPRIRTR